MMKIPSIDLLRYLHPDRTAFVALTLVPSEGSGLKTLCQLFARVECVKFLKWAFAKNCAESYNVFYSVASFRDPKRGATNDNVAAVSALVLDIDRVTDKNRSVVAGGGDVPPSIVVSTSPGHYHLYWLLKEPIRDAELYKSFARQLVERYDGDPAAVDAARKLRLPGFWNVKRGCPCTLDRLENKLAYTPDDLSLVAPDASERCSSCCSPSVSHPSGVGHVSSKYAGYISATLSRAWDRCFNNLGDCSAADYAAAGALYGIGVSVPDAADLVRKYSTARRDELGRRQHVAAYWLMTAEKAARSAVINDSSPLWSLYDSDRAPTPDVMEDAAELCDQIGPSI